MVIVSLTHIFHLLLLKLSDLAADNHNHKAQMNDRQPLMCRLYAPSSI